MKNQQCKHLPSEWYFYFDEVDKNNPDHKGLVLTKQNVIKKWRSFEKAKKSAGKQLDGYEAKDFYRYVGLLPSSNSREAWALSSPPRPRGPLAAEAEAAAAAIATTTALVADSNHPPRNQASQEDEADQPWSLEKIHERRCGSCENCNRSPCGACDSCVHKEKRRVEVGCLQLVSPSYHSRVPRSHYR